MTGDAGVMLLGATAWRLHQLLVDQFIASFKTAPEELVRGRIRRGQTLDAATYVGIQQARNAMMPALDARMAKLDALVLPTLPILAPRIDAVQAEDVFLRTNALLLRNP